MKFLLIFLLIPFQLPAQNASLKSGPWAGNVELRSAVIWAEVSKDVSSVAIVYYNSKSPEIKNTIYYKGTLGNEFNPVKVELNNLEINSTYFYSILLNKKTIPTTFSTKFTTKDLWQYRKPAPDFSFLTGSCAYFNEPPFDRPGRPYGGDSSIFESMAKENGALTIWLGDNWYTREVDYGSVWGLKYRASRDRSLKVLQPFFASMPQYAIWDDHDYGPNDADESYIFKDSSRQIFMNYFCNPSYGEEGKGIYTKVSYSDVDFFLTDDRYFRSSDKLEDSIGGTISTSKHFFGEMQMNWLKNALLFSNATFKIIAVGSQVLNPLSSWECMREYKNEYNDLIHFLEDRKISGVVFLTGDRHHSEVIRMERPSLYPLYDVTVSPFTAGIGKVSGAEINNPYRVNGTLIEEQNYGVISIKGEKGKRVLKVEFKALKGNMVGEWEVSESALRSGASRNTTH